MEVLRTSRLLLRQWHLGDLAPFFDIYSRWEVMRWLGAQPRAAVSTLDEARLRLQRRLERHTALQAPQGFWALVPLGQDTPVGTVLLLPLDGSDEIEVGWHLHPDAEGQGLVTEAARALLDLAGLPRVLALTDQDNVKSQAVAKRLGMTDEGLTDRWYGITARQFATGPSVTG